MKNAAAQTRPVTKKSLADSVYDRISDDILAGRVGCGSILSEARLATEFAVSRGPIREALQRLASEGLVENQANRRAKVIRPSLGDIARIYEVRGMLEAGAAEIAAQRMTAEGLAVVQELCAQAASLLAGSEPERHLARLIELDVAFHRHIVAACDNPYLDQEIGRYHRLIRVMQRTGVTVATQRMAWQAHGRIEQALAARDGRRSREAMQEHIARACELAIEAARDEQPDGAEPS